MPTSVSETDVFSASAQRPNNGELADSASLAQGFDPLGRRTRYLYNRSWNAVYDMTRAPFGAVPGLGSDCKAALTAAMNAAAVAGGGIVTGPAAQYRFDSDFTVPRNVALVMPWGTQFFLNHATSDFLRVDPATSLEDHTTISGISFNSLVANTGKVISCAAGPYAHQIYLSDCQFNLNGANDYLRGPLIELLGAGEVEVKRCRLRVADSNALTPIRQDNAASFLRLLDNLLVMPFSFTGQALFATSDGTGIARGNQFTCAASAGNQPAIRVTSSSSPWIFDGNIFRGAAGAAGPAFRWSALARIVERNNDFLDGTLGYDPANGSLARGSKLDLMPNKQIVQGAVATIDLRPEAGHRSYTIKCSATSGPAIILPGGWFDGQELDFTYTCGGSAVAISFATTPTVGETVPPIGGTFGNTLSGRFVWQQRDASGLADRWIQIGSWGVGSILV